MVRGARQLSAKPLGDVANVSDDRYSPGAPRTLSTYPCGLRAGDRLRLKRELATVDHLKRSTGEVLPRGSLWTVVPGVASEPSVVWLHQPNGVPHTWDDTILDTFELFASAPPVGAHVVLAALSEWVAQLPEESQRLFRLCVGHALPVEEIDSNGLVVLDAREFDTEVGGQFNNIRVESELLQPR